MRDAALNVPGVMFLMYEDMRHGSNVSAGLKVPPSRERIFHGLGLCSVCAAFISLSQSYQLKYVVYPGLQDLRCERLAKEVHGAV